jgi:hypothetical protein
MSPHIKDMLLGSARALDLGATLRRTSVKGIILDDKEALRQDWLAVGNDLRQAMSQHEVEDGK